MKVKARTKAAKRRAGRPKTLRYDETKRRPLPEDTRGAWTTMRVKSIPRERSRPVERTEAEFVPQSAIEKRLMRAMKTIRAVPDKERRFFIMKGASIPYLQEYMDAYNSSDVRVPVFIPTPQDVSDCLVALSWVRHLDKKLWKIMWLRSFGFSFGLIGKYIGRSDETARRWYREGITDAWATANGI